MMQIKIKTVDTYCRRHIKTAANFQNTEHIAGWLANEGSVTIKAGRETGYSGDYRAADPPRGAVDDDELL